MTPDPIPPAAEDPPETRSTAGMTTKVVKGSLWTLAGQIAPLGVSLVTTPFVIRLLGSEGYGTLILIGLIPMYLSFADFGMNLASTKFASGAFALGNFQKELEIVRTAALIALIVSLPVAAAIFIFAGPILGFFNVPTRLHSEALIALRLASITFVANFLCGIFNTPQLTRLRMDLYTMTNGGFRILGIAAVPIVVYLGGGLVGAVSAQLIATLLMLAGNIWISGHLLNHPLLGVAFDRAAFRPMLKFGLAWTSAGIASILLINVEKGVLSITASVKALAYYSVAFTLASLLTTATGSLTQSLLPAFSQLQGIGHRDQRNTLFSVGIRLIWICAVPAIVCLSIIARPFFTIWAGEDFGNNSTIPFYILICGLAFGVIAYVPGAAILAAGRTDIVSKLYWIELVFYTIFVWVLTDRFGIIGAAAAWSIRIAADAIVLSILAKRVADISYSSIKARPIVLASCVMVIPAILNVYFRELNLVVVITVIASGFVYLLIVWKLALRLEEVTWLKQRYRSFVIRSF